MLLLLLIITIYQFLFTNTLVEHAYTKIHKLKNKHREKKSYNNAICALLLLLFFKPGVKPRWPKNYKSLHGYLFGSAPYFGRSSSIKPS